MVWCMQRQQQKELTVYGLMYAKEKKRAYCVWFNVCEGKTTTELTVYGSMYVKEKTTELTVCGSMYVKEKQQ